MSRSPLVFTRREVVLMLLLVWMSGLLIGAGLQAWLGS